MYNRIIREVKIRLFGYVRAYKPNMTFSQFDIYKGIYCSLCKEIGKRYGLLARMTLSYDLAFFALVRLSVNEQCPMFKKSRCSFNPLKKCLGCSLQNEEMKYASDVSMLMVYYKYLDNLDDSPKFKKFFLKLLSPYFNCIKKKAVKNRKEANDILNKMHVSQSETEKKNTNEIDKACHPSATALAELLVLNKTGEDIDELWLFGYNIGRWVYLMDAADDYDDDIKEGGYNPFSDMDKASMLKKAEESLNLTAAEAVNHFNNIKFYRYKAIIKNILFDGTYASMMKVLKKEDRDEKSV